MKADSISKFYYNQWAYPCANIYDYTFLYIKLYKSYGLFNKRFWLFFFFFLTSCPLGKQNFIDIPFKDIRRPSPGNRNYI